jgi:hypothetical protein
MMLERYHCGTTRAVNRLLQRTTMLSMNILSKGITVDAIFAG